MGVMSGVTRVYAGRLAGLQVRSPDLEPIGRVRDVVLTIHPDGQMSRALGLVVELGNKRRIFLPMLRIAAIEPGDVTLASGSVSMRAFQTRSGELTVMGDLVGARIHTDDPELAHLHGARVSVVKQTAILARSLQDRGAATFQSLTRGCDRLVVVVRFLAVLELFRSGQITFEQMGPLAELHLRWTGGDEVELAGVDEYDVQPELEET